MNDRVRDLFDDLKQFGTYDPQQRAVSIQRSGWISDATNAEVLALCRELIECGQKCVSLSGEFLEILFSRLVSLAAERADTFDSVLCPQMASVYQILGKDCPGRHFLLLALSKSGTAIALKTFVELIVNEPPEQDTAVVQVFTPLFHKDLFDENAVFPRLLDGLSHVQLAAPVLDLANYLTREGFVEKHPAADQVELLATLLGDAAQRLAHYEENADLLTETAEQMSEKVDAGVTLAVSLCDALAQIGDTSVVGKLFQALQPKHRRLRTEAAAALARLGEEDGKAELLKLAEEPVARLRVLAYADELALADDIPDEYSTDEARAEAELALHLAQPTQLGFPPTQCELFDRREQYWPSYDDPVDCFLFRFSYDLGPRRYSNIGIAGPLTHSFTADLGDLPPNDIYAVFAGWQAEHEDIYQVEVDRLNETGIRECDRLQRRMSEEGYDDIRPVMLGYFFEDRVLVADALREGQNGLAVADQDDVFWYSTEKGVRPLGPEEVYCIYKGRKFLSTFNPT